MERFWRFSEVNPVTGSMESQSRLFVFVSGCVFVWLVDDLENVTAIADQSLRSGLSFFWAPGVLRGCCRGVWMIVVR